MMKVKNQANFFDLRYNKVMIRSKYAHKHIFFIKRSKMTTDLTVGKPSKVLLKLSLPMFVSVIFQQLYNLADSIIAGQFAGEDALAAVGASYPITMIFMAVAFGFNIGCSVIISQLFGAKNYEKTKTAIWTSFISATIIASVLTVIGVIMSPLMMTWIKTPSNIISDGVLYLQVYLGGLLFLFLYNATTAVFTALGNTKSPLYFLIASSILNIFLDYVLVVYANMGVAGVAWATFIAQGLACVASFIALIFSVKKIPTQSTYKKFSFNMCGSIFKIALPSILQQSFISVGNIMVQSIVNSFGASVIAGFAAATKLNAFAMMCLFNMANGLSTFTAQNVGAKQYNRVKKGFNVSVLYVLVIAVPIVLLFTLGGEYMIKLFVSDISADALQTGMMMLKIVCPFYLVCVFKLLGDGVLRGAGAMMFFLVSTFSDLILRVALSYALSPFIGMSAVFWAWPIGWIVGTALALVFYFAKLWLPKQDRKDFNMLEKKLKRVDKSVYVYNNLDK